MTALALTSRSSAGLRFGATLASIIVLAAIMAGCLPLGVSILAVFLFAGPHNWIEARYFLGRLPGRWGRLRAFFLTGLAGVVLLTGGFAALPLLAGLGQWTNEGWLAGIAVWNTVLVMWVAALIDMRRRTNPRRDWPWVWPAAFLLIGASWLNPAGWDLALVYLHPLMALWILDRELLRIRPELRRAYHLALSGIPFCLVGLWVALSAAPHLPEEDALALRIAQHAGADLLRGISSHFLVAAHAFLEFIHYAVWLWAIPCWGTGNRIIQDMPLVRRWSFGAKGVRVFLAMGLVMVLVLWLGFLLDYPTTRDIYFTVALFHVLAEVPFLLRAL